MTVVGAASAQSPAGITRAEFWNEARSATTSSRPSPPPCPVHGPLGVNSARNFDSRIPAPTRDARWRPSSREAHPAERARDDLPGCPRSASTHTARDPATRSRARAAASARWFVARLGRHASPATRGRRRGHRGGVLRGRHPRRRRRRRHLLRSDWPPPRNVADLVHLSTASSHSGPSTFRSWLACTTRFPMSCIAAPRRPPHSRASPSGSSSPVLSETASRLPSRGTAGARVPGVNENTGHGCRCPLQETPVDQGFWLLECRR